MSKVRVKYGNQNSQFGELYLPDQQCKGTICVFHGGFWSMPHGLDQFDEVCLELCSMGYAVWNIEYRRIGETNYHWSNVFEDAVSAVEHLIEIEKEHKPINLDNVFVMGHSAGGHLSIWLNTQPLKLPIKKYIGLAPILDLERTYNAGLEEGVAERLLSETPTGDASRYKYASPICCKEKQGKEVVIHGEEDDYVPYQWSEDYFDEMYKHGNSIAYIKLEKCGHMEFLEKDSEAFKSVLKALEVF